MTGHIGRRLDALERRGAGIQLVPREMTDAELKRVLVESLGYMPDDHELSVIATEESYNHDAT